MGAERSAGLLIFRRLNSQIEYLLLKASEMDKNWTPPKGIFSPLICVFFLLIKYLIVWY